MPKIRATEALKHIDELAMGSGMMKKHDQLAMLKELRKEAGMKRAPAPVTVDSLAAMGLTIKKG